MSPEQKAEQNKRRLDKLHEEQKTWTPEQWAKYKQEEHDRWAKWNAKQSPEKKTELYKDKLKSNAKRWWRLTPEQREKEKERMKRNYRNLTPEQREKWREKGRINAKLLKEKVIRHYSKGNMKCMNPTCEVPGGAKDIRSLCLDHINGGGKEHERKVRKEGANMYRWILNNNFPPIFQVLCWNCNSIKRIEKKENRFDMKKRADNIA